MIRYITQTDDSPTGKIAYQYLLGLVEIAPVRLHSQTGSLQGAWGGAGGLMLLPIVDPFVNVVCCDPKRWVFRMETPAGPGVVGLYTKNRRNLLIVTQPPTAPEWRHGLLYEAMVAPTPEIAAAWREVGASPTVVPIPVAGSVGALRSLVFPASN